MSPKERIALWSVIAAVLLTVIKVVVGVITNSLGVISEALHSGIDLIAAFATLFAVMRSDLPPDPGHLYGHGKIENLSSLIETILLFATAAGVVYEAFDRLFISQATVSVGWFALLVMVISIIVNYSRSKVMYRTAKKYKSQALEADAAHFSADLITSIVVIVGIVPTAFGFSFADPLAAIGVAAIIVLIGYRIGRKSIDTLMDASPPGMVKLINEESRKVDGVQKVGRIRVRESGSRTFIDINVFIDKVLPLEVAHKVTEDLTKRIQSVIPDSDVIVHAEPLSIESSNLVVRIREESSNFPDIKNIHNIRIFEIDKKLHIDFHIEIEGNLSLIKAHDLSTDLESRVKALSASITEVSSHVEPIDGGVVNVDRDSDAGKILREKLEMLITEYPEIKCLNKIEINKVGDKFNLTLNCAFKGNITVNEAHKIADQLESSIRSKIAGINNVSIHLEPDSSNV